MDLWFTFNPLTWLMDVVNTSLPSWTPWFRDASGWTLPVVVIGISAWRVISGAWTLPWGLGRVEEWDYLIYDWAAWTIIHNQVIDKTTILTVNGSIAAGTVLSVVASWVNYVKSWDNGNLLSSAAAFLASDKIKIHVGGAYFQKASSAIWDSATTFHLDKDLDAGDIIQIIS